MPWTAKDAIEHTKAANTDKLQAQWAAIANSALSKCLDDGGEETECAASAIKQANSVVAKQEEAMPDEKKYALGETAWVSVFGEVDDNQALALAFIQLGVALLQGETGEPVVEEPMEAEEGFAESFSEAGIGYAIGFSEADLPTGTNRAPVELDLKIITPGAGNKRDNYWYSREVLARDSGVFEGVDVFVTDHRENERSERTKVGKIKAITGYTEDGGPIGRLVLYDPDMAEKARNRAAAGELETLHCSILASGTAKKGQMNGKSYKIVESIDHAEAVDLVSRAGAGGKALALAETYQQEVGPMTEEEKPDEEMEESEQEQATFTEQEEPETPAPEKLVQEKVHEALTKTNLPPGSVLKLAESEYSDEAALQEAIKAEVAEVKARTGSGKPFGQGEGTAPLTKASLTEKERVERFNDIMRQVGARTVEV